jgi:hypothetical protein
MAGNRFNMAFGRSQQLAHAGRSLVTCAWPSFYRRWSRQAVALVLYGGVAWTKHWHGFAHSKAAPSAIERA